MDVLGSTSVPITFPPERRTRNIGARVVRGLPYSMILGATFFRNNRSILSFRKNEGFQPSPEAPWVPFDDHRQPEQSFPHLNVLPSEDVREPPGITLSPMAVLATLHQMKHAAWEDDGTLQWKLKLLEPVTLPGYVSRVVDGYVRGPQPQARQLVLTIPVQNFDTDHGAIAGLAYGVQWWEPGTPLAVK